MPKRVSRWLRSTAGWLTSILLALLLLTSSARAETPDQLYATAQEHYLAKRYTEALPIFRTLANKHRSPNARLYVARCLREMGRLDQAHDAMARTVQEATARAMTEPRFDATRKAAQTQLDDLKTRVAYLTLVLPGRFQALEIEINGRPLSNERWSKRITVMPGYNRVRASARGFSDFFSEINLGPGDHETIAVALTAKTRDGMVVAPPPPPKPRPKAAPKPSSTPKPTRAPKPASEHEAAPAESAKPEHAGFTLPPPAPRPPPEPSKGMLVGGSILAALGAVGWVTFAAAGIAADSQFDDVSAACGDTRCTDSTFNDDIDSGETLDTVANVGLVVGIVGLAGGGLLIGLHVGKVGQPAPPKDTPPNNTSAAVPVFGSPSVQLRGVTGGATVGLNVPLSL